MGYDGASYKSGGNSRSLVKLNGTRINSVLGEISVVLTQTAFFADAAPGFCNRASGFVAFDAAGNPSLHRHSPDHRCRYVLRGRWPPTIPDEQAEQSLLSTLLRGVFLGDTDSDHKIDLVGEVGAAAALGMATKLVQPRAIVFWDRRPRTESLKSWI